MAGTPRRIFDKTPALPLVGASLLNAGLNKRTSWDPASVRFAPAMTVFLVGFGEKDCLEHPGGVLQREKCHAPATF